jgi:hypothetical protein
MTDREQERALLTEAYALLAEYNCVLAVSARQVTRAKVKDWLDRTKDFVG